MPPAVVVVGSYNHDLVWTLDALPAPGETRRAGGFRSGPGGKGMNQAVAAARQGIPTAFVGAVGADAFAADLRALAASEGIEARLETVPDAATGCAGILLDAAGRNSIAVALGANERLSVAHVRAQAGLLRSAAVLLAPLESPPIAVAEAFTLARAGGARTLLNPAPVHPALELGLLDVADLLTPNETEFAQLLERFTGLHETADALAGLDDASLAALCARLPCTALVLTLGAAGVFAAPGGRAGTTGPVLLERAYRLPAPAVAVVDTTGAGDAFNGALAAAWAAGGGTLADALPWAVAVASLSTERPGAALAVPRRAETETRFGRRFPASSPLG
ncbi:MAG: ribokinase [Xanthomonadaceae bacterium]|jgi:ribokinase|nr:ribokinase [Xanthomonadaceae bacterium]